jgi:hypothetical protein
MFTSAALAYTDMMGLSTRLPYNRMGGTLDVRSAECNCSDLSTRKYFVGRLFLASKAHSSVLDRRKETRKRNLNFHLPAAISFSNTLRLLENDSSYVTLQDMLDQHCKDKGIHRDDPQLHFLDKLKVLRNPEGTKADFFTLRAELISEVSAKLVPATVISNVSALVCWDGLV